MGKNPFFDIDSPSLSQSIDIEDLRKHGDGVRSTVGKKKEIKRLLKNKNKNKKKESEKEKGREGKRNIY
jgi:hypothetical protein